MSTAEFRLAAELLAVYAGRPAEPHGADYQLQPIGGPHFCQDSGRGATSRELS
ncbi:hypothetical protein [Streptomyces sp. NPDC006551]|uniref:hypothetical protein n=1 Tax=Streptomyces sp. NPDC006551 TaxID=3157178 RepID=UPI0033B3B006